MLRDTEARSVPAAGAEFAPATRSVLVFAADRAQRHELVSIAAAMPDTAVLVASTYYQAVPLVWDECPDVIVVGALPASERRRLPELRANCPDARIVAVVPDTPQLRAEYAALGPDVHLVDSPVDDALSELLGA